MGPCFWLKLGLVILIMQQPQRLLSLLSKIVFENLMALCVIILSVFAITDTASLLYIVNYVNFAEQGIMTKVEYLLN